MAITQKNENGPMLSFYDKQFLFLLVLVLKYRNCQFFRIALNITDNTIEGARCVSLLAQPTDAPSRLLRVVCRELWSSAKRGTYLWSTEGRLF